MTDGQFELFLPESEQPELTFHSPISNRNISFHKEGGDVVGKLSWDDDRFHFEGDADESAQIFFDAVCAIVVKGSEKNG